MILIVEKNFETVETVNSGVVRRENWNDRVVSDWEEVGSAKENKGVMSIGEICFRQLGEQMGIKKTVSGRMIDNEEVIFS